MKIEEIDEEKIYEIISRMNESQLEDLVNHINKMTYDINLKSSKRMKRLGVMCLMLIGLNVIMWFYFSRINIFSFISVGVCLFTAIFDFHKSAEFAKKAKEYKK